ncbi:hypothetical protein QBC44DRAFT_386484 [Cladorrhinum sp. PSN332]|nr:hypothetical protein QBC44DRAFT_386484 [Cladorrhinum sp. PSN332]
MRCALIISLLVSLAGRTLATCEASCPKYTVPTCATDSSGTCLAPASPLKARQFHPSRLFRRTCDTCPPAECPVDSKKCTPGGVKPPQLPPTTVLFDCGQKPTQYSVTVTYVNCPTAPDKKCLVFQLNGEGLEQPKLEISSSPLTSSTSGKFRYNSYCTPTSCAVPIDVVLANEGKTSLCDLTLWIGLHSGYLTDTCWPQGSEINDGNGNWAQEFFIKFECPTVPPACCCCPPPPSLPDKKCTPETAYASGANTLNLPDLGCTKAWGYYQKYEAGFVNGVSVGGVVYTANLLAGKTTDVGDVTVTKKSPTCFSVTLDAAAKFGVGKTHIDISCNDPKTNLGGFCRSPGQYEFNSGCVTVDPYTSSKDICVETACTEWYYFIIHAETYSVVSYDPANPGPYDGCVAYVC